MIKTDQNNPDGDEQAVLSKSDPGTEQMPAEGMGLSVGKNPLILMGRKLMVGRDGLFLGEKADAEGIEHLDDTDIPGVVEPTIRDTITPPELFSYLFIGEHRVMIRGRRAMVCTERPEITKTYLRIAGRRIVVRQRTVITRIDNG